jgi:hypothetical protein
MGAERSIYGSEPIYERLSFCKSAETLWPSLLLGAGIGWA